MKKVFTESDLDVCYNCKHIPNVIPFTNGTTRGYYVACSCKKCGIGGGTRIVDTTSDAIEMWNKRFGAKNNKPLPTPYMHNHVECDGNHEH